MTDERVALGLLLDDPTRHFSDGELQRLLGWPKARVKDAIGALVRDGLAHRNRGFVFATRAAARASALGC